MISHKHQFIFVHIPKCAGTSITEGLKDCNIKRAGMHDTLGLLIKCATNACGDDTKYFTFTCVRNIYAQIVSMVFSRYGQWSVPNCIAIVRQMQVQSVIGGASWTAARISQYINKPIDFIMRFENLQQDWNTLLHKLQLPYRDLPHEKPNLDKDHYNKYYDQKLIDLIQETFAEEIALYEWKFECN